MRKKQSSSQREIIRVYCLISKISLSLTRKTPTRCVCTQQVGLNEKLLFNEEFNDIKQHLARGEKTKQKYDLPGQEVMHRGNQQAFICFPFLKCHPWLPLITSLINKNT